MADIIVYAAFIVLAWWLGGKPRHFIVSFALALFSGIIHAPGADAKRAFDALMMFAPPEWNKAQVENSDKPAENSLESMADAMAIKHSIDPKLFRALIKQESEWDVKAVSPVGAAGLTQLMPKTAKWHCGLEADERFHPERNLDCGASYLAAQLRRFGSVELALAAYNSGPERVAKLGRVPRIKETQNYVKKIMADWSSI